MKPEESSEAESDKKNYRISHGEDPGCASPAYLP
jgi:hypothetical protein